MPVVGSAINPLYQTNQASGHVQEPLGDTNVAASGLYSGLLSVTNPDPTQPFVVKQTIVPNDSLVPCYGTPVSLMSNGATFELHANLIHFDSQELTPNRSADEKTVKSTYCAAQTPTKNAEQTPISTAATPITSSNAVHPPVGHTSTTDLILEQAIASGQGLFQYVSPRAHRCFISAVNNTTYNGPDTRYHSILHTLVERLKQQNTQQTGSANQCLLANRYQLVELANINKQDLAEGDVAQYCLTVIDTADNDKQIKIPFTQYAPPFKGKVLNTDSIAKSKQLLDEHRQLSATNTPSPNQTDAATIIMSYAGIGRNATLIAYDQITAMMDRGDVNQHNLDEVLANVVNQGRRERGPRFIHSEAQFETLRNALMAYQPKLDYLSSLPKEVLTHIASFIPKDSVDAARRTSRSLRAAVNGNVKGIELNNAEELNTFLKYAGDFGKLTSITLGWNLDDDSVRDVVTAVIDKKLPVKVLKFEGEKYTNTALVHLEGQKWLEGLDLNECRYITNAGLVHLQGLTSLLRLGLSWCTNITDSGLAHLKDLTSLYYLSLRGCDLITDDGLGYLKKLTSLQHLDLCNCDLITDAGLEYFEKFTSLQYLDLGRCRQVTDTGLAHLTELTLLRHLDLNRCNRITDAALVHLKRLPLLQDLNLCFCIFVSDSGLAHLKELKFLKCLSLANCIQISHIGLEHLKELTSLVYLSLRGCFGVNTTGLEHLIWLPSLQHLELSGCLISQADRESFWAQRSLGAPQ